MAKAFTEEERNRIKEKIMETALDLLHDKGTKALNISELTKRAGIAQGSFLSNMVLDPILMLGLGMGFFLLDPE